MMLKHAQLTFKAKKSLLTDGKRLCAAMLPHSDGQTVGRDYVRAFQTAEWWEGGGVSVDYFFFFFKGKSFVLFCFFLLTFIDKLYFAQWTLSKERCPICGNCNYKTALAYDSEDWYLYFHILAFVIQENLTKHTVRTTNSFVIAVCLFLSTFFINRW